jgi:hypothetical protein
MLQFCRALPKAWLFPARRPQFGCRKQAIIAQGIIALDSRPLSAQTFLDLWEQFWRQAMAEAGMNHGWLHAPSPGRQILLSQRFTE